MITVAQLIEVLKTMPQDLPVASYGGDENFHFLHESDPEVRLGGSDAPGVYDDEGQYQGSYEGMWVKI